MPKNSNLDLSTRKVREKSPKVYHRDLLVVALNVTFSPFNTVNCICNLFRMYNFLHSYFHKRLAGNISIISAVMETKSINIWKKRFSLSALAFESIRSYAFL